MSMNTSPMNFDAVLKAPRVMFTQEEEIELFRRWRETGDRRIQQKIILNYTPIVHRIVRLMSGYTSTNGSRIEKEDLTSEGTMGLCDAANRYDLNLGFRFSTYAQSWIRGVIYAYIARNYFLVNSMSSGTRKKMFFRLRTMLYQHKESMGSFDITEEIAELFAKEFDTTVSEVYEMLNLFGNAAQSLSETVGRGRQDEEGGLTRGEAIADPNNDNDRFEEADQQKFRRAIIEKATYKLRPREKDIYLSQMLAEKDAPTKLDTLGQKYGISRERVRQLREKSKVKVEQELHRMIKENEITHADLFG